MHPRREKGVLIKLIYWISIVVDIQCCSEQTSGYRQCRNACSKVSLLVSWPFIDAQRGSERIFKDLWLFNVTLLPTNDHSTLDWSETDQDINDSEIRSSVSQWILHIQVYFNSLQIDIVWPARYLLIKCLVAVCRRNRRYYSIPKA